ncbi:MAG: discoidin domain-containing protein, partial [Oscillospiraceae bacterium]|nr:discoidin domain-containing protein [Oscillospiraceae bacterium]
ESAIKKLVRMGADFYFNGLNTDHYDRYATFCTDVVNSFHTVQMEMAMSSNEGSLELLPAMPGSLPTGTVKGLRARNQITVDEISWDLPHRHIRAKITSAVDQTITLIQHMGIKTITVTGATVADSAYGSTARELTLKAGQTAVIDLFTPSIPVYQDMAPGKTASASTQELDDTRAERAIDGNPATRWASGTYATAWIQVDLHRPVAIDRVRLVWESAYAKSYSIMTSIDGQNWETVYTTTDGKGATETIPLENAFGRFLRINCTERVQVDGTYWGYSLWHLMIDRLVDDDEYLSVWGDANCNGILDIGDARVVLQDLVGKQWLTARGAAWADVDGDGSITISDARLILQKLVDKIDKFPVELAEA